MAGAAVGLLVLAVVTGCSADGDTLTTTSPAATSVMAPPERARPAPTTSLGMPGTSSTTGSSPTTTAAPAPLAPAPTIVVTTSSTSTTTTAPATTAPATSLPADVSAVPEITPLDPGTIPLDTEVEIGRSVEGRPITLVRRGDPDGTRVLVIGDIHGNEDAGVAVVDRLRTAPLPTGVELWLVPSMNPDGQAARSRGNAHGVDLNRNFPVDWDVLAEPGDWQYGGPGPASEPETRAIVALGDGVRPDLVVWYHQDLYRLAPANGRRGEIRQRYSELTGIPIVPITGGTYTGTAADWVRTVIRGEGETITVELGETLPDADVPLHVNAVLTVAVEFW